MSTVLAPVLLRKADSFLDKDEQHELAAELGKLCFTAFGTDDGRISTQVRNLQQIAVSATRFADIEDFIKNQMGKKTAASKEWRQVGDKALKQLTDLREQARGLVEDEGQRLLLRLHLARQWSRAVVGAYLYAKAQEEMSNEA